MPEVRTGRFLASSAIVVLLSAAASTALAAPLAGAKIDTAALIPPPSAQQAENPAVEATPAPPPDAAADTNSAAPSLADTPSETAAAAAVADPDAPVAEQLRALADGKFDGIIGSKAESKIIDAFYSGRNYAPLWITDGKPNARANAAIAYLGQVDADGLDPADYPVPNFVSLTDPAGLAEAEIRLTRSVITYSHHASIGRVHWSRVSGDIQYEQKAPEPADVLATMVSTADVRDSLAAYEPQNPGYLALKAKLAEMRAGKMNQGKPAIASGAVLKVGMRDDRVPDLRERLGVPGDGSPTYDKALAEAVKKYQQQHQIAATGTLTAATIDALNGRQPDQSADIIIANMERWRWMPHDLGKTYVIVNLPGFMLRVMHDGKLVWTTKVVDGKPSTPTPIMTADMKFITVNPTWNVPPSIANNEYLPLLQQDPTILARMGLNVTRNPDGTAHISQPPGDNNALGRLRFNFPNKFLVYQHDSNEKYLFSNEKRAASHGCMRVQDPLKYAEVLLSLARPGEGYTQERIRRMYGHNEVDIQFPAFIPVHLTYQTAFVDDDGKLQIREDIYGRDKALLAILKGNERKVADSPIERKDNAARRQLLAIPEQAFGGGWSGQNFFARLFGFPFAAQPAPTPRRPVRSARVMSGSSQSRATPAAAH